MDNYSSTGTAAFGAFFIFWIIFCLAIAAVVIAGYWKVFTKAGKPGWAAIVPIYNYIVLCEIVGKPVWWFLLFLIPCVNFVFIIWVYNLLSKSFGKDEGFTVGLVLLSPIFICILGFGDSVYLGPSAAEARADNRFSSGDYHRPMDNNNPQP